MKFKKVISNMLVISIVTGGLGVAIGTNSYAGSSVKQNTTYDVKFNSEGKEVFGETEDFNPNDFDEENEIVLEVDFKEILEQLEVLGINEYSTQEEIDAAFEIIANDRIQTFANATEDTGGGSLPNSPPIGTKKTVTVKVTNNDLAFIAGTASGASTILQVAFKKITSKLLPGLGLFGSLCGVVGGYSHITGYSGIVFKTYMTYKTTTIFDGQHVTYTGWHVTGYSTPSRYK